MFYKRDVISILDFTKNDLMELFNEAEKLVEHKGRRLNILNGKILATAFFEPSTRTRLSFATAMLRLGGHVIDLSSPEISSLAKGENIADTIRMLDAYSDIIVIRHKVEGTARFAAEIAEVPVINAGDGTRHHPTQAMLDLFTIYRHQGQIDGLTVGVLGDLRYGRAATSFIYGLSIFRPKKLFLIAPEILRVRDEVKSVLEERGIQYEELSKVDQVIEELDVLYVTRIQKERFTDPTEYERVRGSYRVDKNILKDAKENLIILHPLPRVDELGYDVDGTVHAKYFVQAYYGVPVRMALLKLILVG